jgi:hypothetical protein
MLQLKNWKAAFISSFIDSWKKNRRKFASVAVGRAKKSFSCAGACAKMRATRQLLREGFNRMNDELWNLSLVVQ